MRILSLAAVFLLVAGCGATNGSNSAGQQAAPPYAQAPVPAPSGMVVKLRQTTLGKVLTGGNGMTLYLFEKDAKGKPSCYDACADAWEPYVTQGKPLAAEGVNAGLLGTVARTDGNQQVVYAGHPLYTYEDDKKPGDVSGNDKNEFGADWYAVKSGGQAAE